MWAEFMVDVVDLILVVVLAGAAYLGARQGFIKQACLMVGVVGGLCVTAFAYGSLAFLSDTSAVRSILLLILMLAIMLLCYSVSLTVSAALARRYSKHHMKWRWAHMTGGAVMASLTAGISLWIIAAMFGNVSPGAMQREIANSQVFSLVGRVADIPPLFRSINRLLQPFASPSAFANAEPAFNSAETPVNRQFDALDTAVARTSSAVVKIHAWGCGSTAEGSGFIIGKRLVMTNAHILAGAGRISIEAGGATVAANTVWFDPKLDDAVLITGTDLPAAPLSLRAKALPAGAISAVLGYPGNGGLKVHDATVLQLLNATGYDIYGTAKTSRDIYAVRSTVEPGNSGGPLIDTNGRVAGLVFGNSTSQSQTGYAISASELQAVVQAVANSPVTVGTGACAG